MILSGMLLDQANERYLTDGLSECGKVIDDWPVLALLADKERALVPALRAL